MWGVLSIFSTFILFLLWQLFTYYQETDREIKSGNSISNTFYIIRELYKNYWPYSYYISWIIFFVPRCDKLKLMYTAFCVSKYIIMFLNLIRYVQMPGEKKDLKRKEKTLVPDKKAQRKKKTHNGGLVAETHAFVLSSSSFENQVKFHYASSETNTSSMREACPSSDSDTKADTDLRNGDNGQSYNRAGNDTVSVPIYTRCTSPPARQVNMRWMDWTVINIVCSLALLNLLWHLYTFWSLLSYLLLSVFAIYNLIVHRPETGDDYISENIDRLYEERPEFFEELKEVLTRLNYNQSSSQSDRGLIHSLHGEAAHNACASPERLESSITRLSVGGSPQMPNSPRNNTTDLEPSMTSLAASGVSNDQPYAESEHSGHDPLSGSDLEVDNEAESHSVNCCNRHDVNVDEPNESVAAETDGLVVDTATAEESKVDKAIADESKVNKSTADESKVDKAIADESKVDKAIADESKVDKAIADESKVDKENLKTTDKPSNLTSQHLEDKVCKDSSLIIDRTHNESDSPTVAVNPVTLRREQGIYDVSHNRENKQVPGLQQADMRKAGKYCVSTQHQGNPGQRSQTCAAVFSPTDDPEKLQYHQREHYPQATSSDPVLLPTYPLEDGQHHETTESSIPENTDVCKNQVQRPGPTLTDPEAKHDRCSDHNNGCMDLHKQMIKQTVNLQEEPTKSTTTQADRKTQQARSSDQDNVCLNGQPSSSQEAPVELHPTKLEAQKKQKGTDAVEKEDTPLDGRPSVKDKGTTLLTEEPANLTQQTYFQSSVSNISMSAGSRQNGNQPVTIQRDHTEKWPTESSSDSE